MLSEPQMSGLTVRGEAYRNLYIRIGTYENSKLASCQFEQVEFEGTWMVDAQFQKCSFDACLFYDVQAYGTAFRDDIFRKVTFSGCNLANADFTGSIFSDVVFGKDNIDSVTDISGACFEQVDMTTIKFVGVEFDSQTVFPPDFDPDSNVGLVRAPD